MPPNTEEFLRSLIYYCAGKTDLSKDNRVCETTAMLKDRNNTMSFLWEVYSILMQISSIVLVLQYGRRAHTLLESKEEIRGNHALFRDNLKQQ